MTKLERVALIGFGAIGRAVADGLLAAAGDDAPVLAAVLVRPGRAEPVRDALPAGTAVVEDVAGLRAAAPGLVVECAGQAAVAEHAEAVLAAGIDLMVISTGALAAPGRLERLTATAKAVGAQLIAPAGAIAGLDGLGALRRSGLSAVTYTSTKPPLAWRGTAAEEQLDLESLAQATTFFEGSARDAALAYPKNANLAATVALAGLGLDETRVRLVADPAAQGNTGRIEAEGAAGRLSVTMGGAASANPKTSASTAWSLLDAILRRGASFVI
ncbi:aspartate dehydrogenase [Marinibaculum pumilum]|uniref:L-aspartate dehydrogenase n=1 Tax=Marinibaculum pumilum TaxID=1766165 RepID=A0ABV7KTV3_9PROT